MQIKIEEFDVRLTREEAQDIVTSILAALEQTVRTHWVYHPESFDSQAASRIDIITQLGPIVGIDVDGRIASLRSLLKDLVAEKAK